MGLRFFNGRKDDEKGVVLNFLYSFTLITAFKNHGLQI